MLTSFVKVLLLGWRCWVSDISALLLCVLNFHTIIKTLYNHMQPYGSTKSSFPVNNKSDKNKSACVYRIAAARRWCISSTTRSRVAKHCVYSTSAHLSWLFNFSALSRIWQQNRRGLKVQSEFSDLYELKSFIRLSGVRAARKTSLLTHNSKQK